ncbi:type II toxin-antitoxin system Phd/YefM family antitoxin [Sphingomonas sp. ID0503]|uniref:type II toxin-antitoxin system Phd/YefM family antitoxin n=1 Tax=Sphingomonas sp. ID0503 TaxID=3399691 RepID=UPI003AFAAFE5
MQVSVSDAKAQLTELVRRAEAGEEVVLTRHGKPAVRLVAAERPRLTKEDKLARLRALRGAAKDTPGFQGVDAAHSADFLYDERGLPA